MGYPPAAHMLFIHGSCHDEEQLTKGMYYLARFARQLAAGVRKASLGKKEASDHAFSPEGISVIGPAPEAVSRIKDMYRQVMYLKGQSGDQLLFLRHRLEQYIAINPGFREIYIQYDFN